VPVNPHNPDSGAVSPVAQPPAADPIELDLLESTASAGGRTEKLNSRELYMLEQLLRYAEQPVTRDSLRSAAGFDDDANVSDRKMDNWVRGLMRKTGALNPAFPVVRQVPPDCYMYSRHAPRRRRS